jgi:hypothetical protein
MIAIAIKADGEAKNSHRRDRSQKAWKHRDPTLPFQLVGAPSHSKTPPSKFKLLVAFDPLCVKVTNVRPKLHVALSVLCLPCRLFIGGDDRNAHMHCAEDLAMGFSIEPIPQLRSRSCSASQKARRAGIDKGTSIVPSDAKCS